MARWVDEAIDELDLSPLWDAYRGVGSDAHPPELVLKGVVLEYLDGRPSPAQWYRDFRDSSAIRWISRGVRPSRSAMYDFRDRVGPAVENLVDQIVQGAQAAGFLSGKRMVLDGTVIRSQASRHRLLNKSRLDRRLAALKLAMQQEAAGQSIDPFPKWMAKTTRGRQRQFELHTAAAAVLQERLEKNAARPKDKRLDERHVLVSPTDPEAPIGRDKEKVLCALYNLQFQVDSQSLMIADYATNAQPTDTGLLPEVLDSTKDVLGFYPAEQLVDAGYVSIPDLRDCATRGVDLIGPYQENDYTARKKAEKQSQKPAPQLGKELFQWQPEQQTYVCPQGHVMSAERREKVARRGGDIELEQTQYRCSPVHCQVCPLRDQCCQNPKTGRTIKRLEGEELVEQHLKKMATPEMKEIFRTRGSIIERSFGDCKGHRNFRRFHCRGRDRSHAEIGLLVLATNLLHLRRLRKSKETPSAAPG